MLVAVSFLQPTPTTQTPPHRGGTPSPCDTFVPELLPVRNVHLSHTRGTNSVLWGRELYWFCVGVLTGAPSSPTRLREKNKTGRRCFVRTAKFSLLVNRNPIEILIPTLMRRLFLSCTRPEVGCFYKFIWGKMVSEFRNMPFDRTGLSMAIAQPWQKGHILLSMSLLRSLRLNVRCGWRGRLTEGSGSTSAYGAVKTVPKGDAVITANNRSIIVKCAGCHFKQLHVRIFLMRHDR